MAMRVSVTSSRRQRIATSIRRRSGVFTKHQSASRLKYLYRHQIEHRRTRRGKATERGSATSAARSASRSLTRRRGRQLLDDKVGSSRRSCDNASHAYGAMPKLWQSANRGHYSASWPPHQWRRTRHVISPDQQTLSRENRHLRACRA